MQEILAFKEHSTTAPWYMEILEPSVHNTGDISRSGSVSDLFIKGSDGSTILVKVWRDVMWETNQELITALGVEHNKE